MSLMYIAHKHVLNVYCTQTCCPHYTYTQLLEATEARAATLGNDNVRLREQLHDMRTEFEQLLCRWGIQ